MWEETKKAGNVKALQESPIDFDDLNYIPKGCEQVEKSRIEKKNHCIDVVDIYP